MSFKLRNKRFENQNKILLVLQAFIFIYCCFAVDVNAGIEALSAPPEINVTDDNGVNLLDGRPGLVVNDLHIGGDAMAMGHSISSFSSAFFQATGPGDNYFGLFEYQASTNGMKPSVYVVTFNHTSSTYKLDLSPLSEDGSTLSQINSTTYRNVRRDGTKLTISTAVNRYEGSSLRGVVTKVEMPNGLIIDIYYKSIVINGYKRARVQSAVQSNGLQIKYNYAVSTITSDDNLGSWVSPTSVVALNAAIDYCSPTADTCALTKTWPTATYTWSGNKFSVHDQSGSTTSYTKVDDDTTHSVNTTLIEKSGLPPTSIRYANSYTFSPFVVSGGTPVSLGGVTQYGLVSEVTTGSSTWTYNYETNSYGSQGTMTGPINSLSVIADATFGVPVQVSKNQTTVIFEQSLRNRPSYVIHPAGNKTYYFYDDRGNITQTKDVASGFSDVIRMANYDVTCLNIAKCNQPNYVVDAMNNRTDYAYNSNGFLESTTLPAGKNNIRPQTRYFYEQRKAWVKNASGGYISNLPIWLLVKESTCKDGAASGAGCQQASDEVITEYDYGLDSGPNNLWLKGVTVTYNGKIKRTCYGYDIYGNRISETSPAANLSVCP